MVLSVFNGERHLERSLRSILDQTLADFELIVVDDGSTDGTPEILAGLQRDDSRAVVVRQENRGLTASLNRGMGAARGAYLARQDADDLSFGTRLERQSAYLDANPAVAAVGSAADVIDASGAVTGALTVAHGAHAARRALLSLRTTPVHGSMMMRASAITEVGGYREAFRASQDYDLWLRLSERYEIDNLGEILYQWRLQGASVYATRRAVQLKYAAIALAFARERAACGQDSYQLLVECSGDLDWFIARYPHRAFVQAMWGELLLRGLGNSAAVRDHFRRAVGGGYLHPWTVGLFGWTQLRLPWPGGRPLAPAETPGSR